MTITNKLIDLATGYLTSLTEIQAVIDEAATSITTKTQAEDLGFLCGLNGKLSNDVNPWTAGALALCFDHGFEAADLDQLDFPFDNDDDGGEPQPTEPASASIAASPFTSPWLVNTVIMAALCTAPYFLPFLG